MSGFLDAKIAQFLPKNLTNRATISSIFIQKLNDFIYREIPPDLIRTSLIKEDFYENNSIYQHDSIFVIMYGSNTN